MKKIPPPPRISHEDMLRTAIAQVEKTARAPRLDPDEWKPMNEWIAIFKKAEDAPNSRCRIEAMMKRFLKAGLMEQAEEKDWRPTKTGPKRLVVWRWSPSMKGAKK